MSEASQSAGRRRKSSNAFLPRPRPRRPLSRKSIFRSPSARSASCISYPTVVPFVVLMLGLVLGVTVNYSHFVTGSNLSTVLTQVTIIGILGIAQTLVILTAGIDLSVGVIMVISSVVMGRLGVIDGLPLIIAFPPDCCAGSLAAALNGALVTRLKMPPFIVTLGTLSIIGALNTFYSQSETIRDRRTSRIKRRSCN